MAVIKYKDKEGNYHKVSIGGGSGTDEVYIGSDTPPSGAKVWIDPTGTPSSPSQPSAGVEVIDNLESESTTAALSANQGRVLKEMIGQGGRGAKVYIIPEGVMKATAESPHILTDDEISDITDLLTNMNNSVIKLVDGYENIMSQSASGGFVGEMGVLMANFTYINVESVVTNDNSIGQAMVIHIQIVITNQNGGVWSGWSGGKRTRSLF